METPEVIGILIYIFGALLFVIPLWRILPRAGLPQQAALAAFIPFGVLVVLWVLAFRRWPLDDVSGRF